MGSSDNDSLPGSNPGGGGLIPPEPIKGGPNLGFAETAIPLLGVIFDFDLFFGGCFYCGQVNTFINNLFFELL